jgi:hypothetical protein
MPMPSSQTKWEKRKLYKWKFWAKRFEGTIKLNLLEAGGATLWVRIATCFAGRHTDFDADYEC